jgi:glycosyltransferase involved in cell wall biosynthesis
MSIPEETGGPMSVSVVIPCYNAEPFVGEAIESALSQSPTPVEVIVVDDGSDDGSVRVSRSFGDRVRVLSSGHAGVSAARNTGLLAARENLVAWLDADDVWEAGKLADQIPRFDDPVVGLVYGQTRRFRPGSLSPPWPMNPPQGDIFERLYLDHNFIPTSTVMVRRQALVDAGGFDGAVAQAEDLDAWLRVAARWSVVAIPRVLCRYRVHSNQFSRDHAKMFRCALQVRERLADEFERRTGTSPTRRRQLVAAIFLDEVSRFIAERDLARARTATAVLQEAFASDTADLRRAIARKRLVASLPRPVFWVHDILHGRRPKFLGNSWK